MYPHDLIYDVGVCDGADSAYYLTQARRVVGVEASPVACKALRERFATELAEGRYILVEAGIAEGPGELTFWVCHEHPEWSSFDKALTEREGNTQTAVKVQARTFASVIEEFGIPDFCKIDIEGHDIVCLKHLTPATAPRYLSVELAHEMGDILIAELRRLGYGDYKVISQRTLSPVHPELTGFIYGLKNAKLKGLLRRIDQKLRGMRWDGNWRFPFASSGTFGEKTPGHWYSADRAFKNWQFLRDVDHRYNGAGLDDWFDVHVRKA
jgi:FkbM family methyltransferase